MADIDFTTDLTEGQFRIVLGSDSRKVTGNRALLNRFEITFFTRTKIYREGDNIVVDPYGGNADIFINKPYVINNIQAISVAMSAAIEQTVAVMKADDTPKTPNTERIQNAVMTSIDTTSGYVVAKIQIIPVEVESYDLLKFNLPITKV